MAGQLKRQVHRLSASMQSVWMYLAIALGLAAVAAFAVPGPIADNTFLRAFLPAEYLPSLIVLVTVTLASIVTVHVKLNTMEDREDVDLEDKRDIISLRKKANDIARFFLVIPMAAIALLVWDGFLQDASPLRAWMFSGLVALLLASVAATYEVQKIVIELSELPDRR